MDNVIKYSSGTFTEFKNDLITLIKELYPEVINDFNDSSIGSMLIDLNAGIANNLTNTIDRTFQETQLENAKKRNSLKNIAINMGLNIPNKRPSVTVIDLSVTVPVLGDKPDSSYYPVLGSGTQISGGGLIFETTDIIDWNNPLSSLGYSNRSIIPNYNSNGVIINYTINKREIIYNGKTVIFKKTINSDNIVPFYSITLPENNVIDIDSVILIENNNTIPTESDFNNFDYKYHEVEYLAQQKIFIEKNIKTSDNIKKGEWVDITKKFIKEFTDNGYCKITFGSGDIDSSKFKSTFIKEGVTNKDFLDNFLNNTSLGEKLKSGYVLYVKYRIGGGSNTNIGPGVLTQINNDKLKCNGSRYDYNQLVIKSLKVNNVTSAIGGNDGLTTEQLRNLIKYNFSSQNRNVVLNDYDSRVYKMPGKYGSPFRAKSYKLNNKVMISILGLGNDGKLSNSSNSLLKDNITEYLTQYKMINDYIEIKDGKIINLAFDIDIYVKDNKDISISNSIINLVKNYMDVKNHNMNEDLYLSNLYNEILSIKSVLNILDIRVYNKTSNGYSINTVSQKILDNTTGLIKLENNTVYSLEDSMFEIKYPENDIKVYIRKYNN